MRIIFLFAVALSFVSCLEDKVPVTKKTPLEQALKQHKGKLPEYKYIDINNDGIIDFVIDYIAVSTPDYPPSIITLTGKVITHNNNQLLHKHNYSEGMYISSAYHLSIGDTIKKEYQENNLYWTNLPADIITKKATFINIYGENYIEYEWETEWTIFNDSLTEFFIGFKIANYDYSEIGWMLLKPNIEQGDIELIDKIITDSDYLVVSIL